jgi:glycosyltransferase involved in cell wall biosynthesis
MSDPVATIVLTTHDRPVLARRALASALGQTLAHVEVVVVDDGSVPAFATGTDDPRVRVVRHDAARGVTAARNAGLAVACGEWITFLDDDDVLEPEMLERALDAAARSTLPPPVSVNPAVLLGRADPRADEVLVPATALERGADYHLEGRGAGGRAANSLVVPTATLREIGGFDEAYVTFEHDDLGLRLNRVASIQGIADPLYRMTAHAPARLSARHAAIPGDMERTLVKHAAAFARHPSARAHYLGSIAWYHLEAGHRGDAIRWALRAVRAEPTSARLWAFLGAAVAGPRALDAYRRVVPPEAQASVWALQRSRLRKYGRRVVAYPRAVIAAPPAWVTRVLGDRVAGLRRRPPPRAVLLLCIYRRHHAPTVVPLATHALDRGWEVRLWALDEPAPALASVTVGHGPGAKFPLLNGMLHEDDPVRFDWVVVADDDLAFGRRTLTDLLVTAEAAGLDLVQPAHTERSHRELEFTVRRPFSVARHTSFVEIGPLFAVRRPWTAHVLPFPPAYTMGWGLELEWSDLSGSGMRLGIVDGVPIRHLSPVGKGYAKDDERARLRALLDARGLDSVLDVQRVEGTWRPWQARPAWPAPR